VIGKFDQMRIVKEIFEGKQKNRRKFRKTRFRWLEDVEDDLLELKMKRWLPKTVKEKSGHVRFEVLMTVSIVL
jgi:hypothetical protein